jgi:hypothetical protein
VGLHSEYSEFNVELGGSGRMDLGVTVPKKRLIQEQFFTKG